MVALGILGLREGVESAGGAFESFIFSIILSYGNFLEASSEPLLSHSLETSALEPTLDLRPTTN